MVPHYRLVSDKNGLRTLKGAWSWVVELIAIEDELDGLLDDLFVGVGEVVVHGHNFDRPDSHYHRRDPYNMLAICTIAARHHAPVLVHWDFGTVDVESTVSADQSYNQLEDLLTAMEDGVEVIENDGSTTRHAAKLILGHCGLGPLVDELEDVEFDAWTADTYAWRLDVLLFAFPNLYVDIAGLQTNDGIERLYAGGDPTSPTAFGTFVLELIEDYDTRVIFGLDGTAGSSADTRGDSIQGYLDFMRAGGIGPKVIAKVTRDNIPAVIADQPTV